VKVDDKRAKDAVPTLNMDWFNYGGITRDVKLVTTPEKFIAEHRIWLESESSLSITGCVKIAGAAAGEMVELMLPELQVQVSAKTDDAGLARFHFMPHKISLWSPNNPKLYTVHINYEGDSVEEEVGFRTVRTQGRQILLNGKPIFLRGISVHEEFPLAGGGRVNSPAKAKQLLLWAKELNCNFVRLAHYPHNEAMTRLADQIGLLVWSEIPVYWTINWTNEATFQNAEQQLTDEFNRDSNRASIIIWSLGNETPVSPERTDFFKRLAARARELDSTRLLSAAMERHFQKDDPDLNVVEDPLAEAVDVVAFNEYIGWYDGLPEKCSRVRWQIPYDKPVFISEFGGDAKQGLHGDKSERWTEEFQTELYRQTLPMLGKIDGLAGFSPWILVDFRSPKRVLPGVQDGFNRKGLISSNGKKKQAFFILQDYYRQRAKQETP
jgi:beta-glucuronidase